MRPGDRRRPSLLLLALVGFVLVLVVGACAAGGGDDEGGDARNAGDADAAQDAPAESAAERKSLDNQANLDLAESASYGDDFKSLARDTDSTGRKIIAKGNVSCESDDVAATVFHVGRIADEHGGEITERETTTNKDGVISTARLLLRVPVDAFDKAFQDLEGVADLTSSNTGKEDVTTKVIDTKVRIRAQRRSLQRVEQLFDRAQSISDIIRIESQVSRRQADLESLERRLSYLNDQTSMSTISVNISLPPEKKEKTEEKKEPEEAGFLAGLEDGWDGLKSFGTDLATLTGRLLPFATVLLVVGGPLWLLVRRLRRRPVAS
ncbi:hypothetical protein DJ010_13105 [Nocardioides silvaticus]|uniref:DUF4349 domain-containing protein n=1 Tax=Nocardioides silvaticus TaxID=2201891 RepID=A0A316THR4_9ACTN|nr:DUF4349 domain-containing protein [Nocardioides silvaticus]PWN02635.1 hypothetical protein DJ010_13105 [Nocardioides silvaticus]